MKVDQKIGGNLQGVDTAKAGKLSSKSPTGLDKMSGTKNTPGAEKIDVSERAQMMAKAKDIASRDSIDEAKVARLQKLIDDGQYKTDANAIADRLVDEHMQFPD